MDPEKNIILKTSINYLWVGEAINDVRYWFWVWIIMYIYWYVKNNGDIIGYICEGSGASSKAKHTREDYNWYSDGKNNIREYEIYNGYKNIHIRNHKRNIMTAHLKIQLGPRCVWYIFTGIIQKNVGF